MKPPKSPEDGVTSMPAAQAMSIKPMTGLDRYRAALWEKSFEKLLEFHRHTGHFKVPHWILKQTTKYRPLAYWISDQRCLKKHGKLSSEHQQRLEAIGFPWERLRRPRYRPRRENLWEEQFEKLREFKRQHGHFKVPLKSQDTVLLYNWMTWQRNRLKYGRLTAKRQQQLDAIGFPWKFSLDNHREKWMKNFDALVAFHQIHGHFNVPIGRGGLGLRHWIEWQCRVKKAGRLRPEYEQRLLAIGMPLETRNRHNDTWEVRFTELVAYQKRFGHCNVPVRWHENKRLVNWVNTQRLCQRQSRLAPNRYARLTELGFIWSEQPYHDRHWEERFIELVAYQKRFGHCNVPVRWPENKKLGDWVQAQRISRNCRQAVPEHFAQLKALGFLWNVPRQSGKQWEIHYANLIVYQKRFGHSRVPKHWSENHKLANWVRNQRAFRRNGSLSSERMARLKAIHFEWGRRQTNPGIIKTPPTIG